MEPFFLIKRNEYTPAEADFCLTLTDDCMAPHIKPGDSVYVSCREPLDEMDAGIFLYNDTLVCRQWCCDYAGTLHLLCANPARQAQNIAVPAHEKEKCLCLGKVLLQKPLPAPVYL